MDESGQQASRSEGDSQEQHEQRSDQADDGHSGEGAASALAHMKSQNKQRQLASEPEDGAGSGSRGHAQ